MTTNSLPNALDNQHLSKPKDKRLKLQNTQEKMYNFLLRIVKSWQPEEVLRVFKRTFVDCLNSDSKSSLGIYIVLLDNDEQDFRHTIKRCCYILINNWETTRRHKYIQELVALFANYNSKITPNTSSRIKTCKNWLENFVNSTDYQELKLFAYRNNEEQTKQHWVHRYSSYLLFAQSVNEKNPKEQKEAARKLSKVLKDKYKFDLAMYIARSQSQYPNSTSTNSTSTSAARYRNPSILGDNVLRLIKTIVVKKGVFSYENIAHIFIKQTQNQAMKNFKVSLEKYLIFSVQQPEILEILRLQLLEKLEVWKPEYSEQTINKHFLLRLCNRVIDCLTTENGSEPSSLFVMLLSQGHPLTLVIVLLKIILISPHSRSHLEIKIAELIRYYDKYPEEECQWFINFIEIFNITFAIYAENVEYNLIKMEEDEQLPSQEDLDSYRVFSQVKGIGSRE
jgi:hypothetical protein